MIRVAFAFVGLVVILVACTTVADIPTPAPIYLPADAETCRMYQALRGDWLPRKTKITDEYDNVIELRQLSNSTGSRAILRGWVSDLERALIDYWASPADINLTEARALKILRAVLDKLDPFCDLVIEASITEVQ